MQPMQKPRWKHQHIKQCKTTIKQAMLSDEHQLVAFSEDFGHVFSSRPKAICLPNSLSEAQEILAFAHNNALPITMRGNGLSQCGQALSLPHGLILSLSALETKAQKDEENNAIWVGANTSWSEVLENTLAVQKAPYVVPYNCDLSVAGVLSAGGIGASSFKFGPAIQGVDKLEVITAKGAIEQVDAHSPLFHACLGGQGRFACIHRARLKLKSCKKQVRTFFLLYLDAKTWLADLEKLQTEADYLESFCTPAIQGAKLMGEKRSPFAQWFYAIHLGLEFTDEAPGLQALNTKIQAWKILHVQDESIHSYMHRHDARFAAMKLTGQWEQTHLWYECFLPYAVFQQNLEELLARLPIFYANILQVVPIKHQASESFLALPEAENIIAIMILNPGLPPALVPVCMDLIKNLDALFLNQGGKRYLSGFLGQDLEASYWQKHFGPRYQAWLALKKIYDPKGVFSSLLYHA